MTTLFAYLDQGTGSYAFQALVAGFFSVCYLVKRACTSMTSLIPFAGRRRG